MADSRPQATPACAAAADEQPDGGDAELPTSAVPSEEHARRLRAAEELEAREQAEAQEQRRRIEEESLRMIRNHCQEFRTRNPEATYTGWIAAILPENVTLDPRLQHDNNPWIDVWNEASGGDRLRCARRICGGGSREGLLADRLIRHPPAGWGGLVDVTLGVVFTLVAIVVVVVFETPRGLLLGVARLCELGRRAVRPEEPCSTDKLAAGLAAPPLCLLWFLQLLMWLAAVIILFVGVVVLELVALTAALACGVLSLSLKQARWTHRVTSTVAFATQAAMRRLLVRARILQWDHVTRAEIEAPDSGTPTSRRRKILAGAAATAVDGRPWLPQLRRSPRCPAADAEGPAAPEGAEACPEGAEDNGNGDGAV